MSIERRLSIADIQRKLGMNTENDAEMGGDGNMYDEGGVESQGYVMNVGEKKEVVKGRVRRIRMPDGTHKIIPGMSRMGDVPVYLADGAFVPDEVQEIHEKLRVSRKQKVEQRQAKKRPSTTKK